MVNRITTRFVLFYFPITKIFLWLCQKPLNYALPLLFVNPEICGYCLTYHPVTGFLVALFCPLCLDIADAGGAVSALHYPFWTSNVIRMIS